MEIKKGISASDGIAIGRVLILESEDLPVAERRVSEGQLPHELERLQAAVGQADQELAETRERVQQQLGEETCRILDTHRALLHDPEIRSQIEARLRQDRLSAEFAVARTFRKFRKTIESLEDTFFAQRAADIRDVENRVLRALKGSRPTAPTAPESSEPAILVAPDLSPTQTVGLDKGRILGFATDAGGPTSHTAIVAKALRIPAVVGLGAITREVHGGDLVIVDGTKGIVIIDPDEHTLDTYAQRRVVFQARAEALVRDLKEKPVETVDGHRIELWANIELAEDLYAAKAYDAHGVGLYRTEFLFRDVRHMPTEEEHFRAYRRALEIMHGDPVIFRSFDLGGDKFPAGSGAVERNPFLGCRSLRYCFAHPELFRTQLKAILRASYFGDVWLMFPMVSTLEDLDRARDMLYDCMDDLRRQQEPFREDLPLGIMMEVPSIALCARDIAGEVDFVSIGTNDLVQYTLAVDRVNAQVADRYEPSHPSMLRLIREIIQAGRERGTKVSMCGEMCGEPIYTVLLLGLGLDSLSLNPGRLLQVKQIIRSVTLGEAMNWAEEVLGYRNARDTEAFLRERTRVLLPELFS